MDIIISFSITYTLLIIVVMVDDNKVIVIVIDSATYLIT